MLGQRVWGCCGASRALGHWGSMEQYEPWILAWFGYCIDCGGEHTGSRASGTPCFRLLSTLHADMCVCVNTHICIYIYIYMCVCIHIYIYICMYMHTPTFTYTSVRVYLPVCLPACLPVCLLTCGPSKHVHTYIDT